MEEGDFLLDYPAYLRYEYRDFHGFFLIDFSCPSINEKICARSRKAKILTAGIH